MRFLAATCTLFAAAVAAQPSPQWHAATPEEERLDARAFAGVETDLRERLTDIQSVVVVRQGRLAYQYDRDGNPQALRDTQSVAKSALAALVGTALQQGHIRSLDQAVVDLVPEWRPLNDDPRAHAITVRHLLAMTAGFEVNDPGGIAAPLAPPQAWGRKLRTPPGQSFVYDNSVMGMLAVVIARASGRSVADYAREALVRPLDLAEPDYRDTLHLRTVDMAKLGQLVLQDGVWQGRAVLPPGFAAQMTAAASAGGPPVGLPYGLSWWVPSDSTFFASGYAGQFVWVHRPLGLVVAVTSTVSPGSQQRGQALQLIRGRLFQAAQKLPAAP